MRSIVLVEGDESENENESAKNSSKNFLSEESLGTFSFDYYYKLEIAEMTSHKDLMANIGSAIGLVSNGLDVTTLLSEAHTIEEPLVDHIVRTLCSVLQPEQKHRQHDLEITCYEIIDTQINDLLSSGSSSTARSYKVCRCALM
jgi:hypothetical protein